MDDRSDFIVSGADKSQEFLDTFIQEAASSRYDCVCVVLGSEVIQSLTNKTAGRSHYMRSSSLHTCSHQISSVGHITGINCPCTPDN